MPVRATRAAMLDAMRSTPFWPTLVAVLLAAACGPPRVGVFSPSEHVRVVPIEIGCDEEPSDSIIVHGAELAGSRLRLDVSHGGGCEEHTYRVCGAARLLASNPGQWRITVVHDAHGDVCEAELRRVLEVDLESNRPFDLSGLEGRSLTVWVR